MNALAPTGFLLLALSGLAYADEGPQRVDEYLHAGWEIKAATWGPKPSILLQKGDQAVWCQMRDTTNPVTVKGVTRIMTEVCAVVR